MYKWFVIICFCCISKIAVSQLKLPALLSDGMVLQQKSTVKLWGTSLAGQKITVRTSWNKKKYRAKTGLQGDWAIFISTPEAGGPYNVAVKGPDVIIIHNVLIGEVWLASGQSNMDMPVKGYPNTPVLNANDILLDSPDDNVRLFHVGARSSAIPLADVKGNWQEANAASVQNFSAVGYQFAKFLHQHLKVPVGIIQASWPGSAIEAWMDKQLVADVLKDSLTTDKSINTSPHRSPGNLFNGMIAPLMSYKIAGTIWYQGEQNRYNYFSYAALQTAMVDAWHAGWNHDRWPFYYVQLAPMYYPPGQRALVPRMRETQEKLLNTLSNSGMAVAIDAGEEYNIHPADKTIIARRLAYLALGKTYHKKGIAYSSPQFGSMITNLDTAVVKFINAPNGLTTFGKTLTQFEVAGSEKVFYPAVAVLQNDAVKVYSTHVKQPIAVRYAFKDWAFGELYSTEGLPVSSFRTDNW